MTTSVTHNETAPVLVDVASIPRLGLFRLSGQLAVFLVTLAATQQGAGQAISVDDETATPINTVAGTIVESLDGNLTVNDPAPALLCGGQVSVTDPATLKTVNEDAQDVLSETGAAPTVPADMAAKMTDAPSVVPATPLPVDVVLPAPSQTNAAEAGPTGFQIPPTAT